MTNKKRKELLSTDKVGLVIDTNEWLTGISIHRHLAGSTDNKILLKIGFLCLILYIVL